MYGQAVCSCIPGYSGSPPTCKPECVISSECPLYQACVNQKCIDPCPGTCGISALCQVINHNPICTCPERYSGDPFVRCQLVVGRSNNKSLTIKNNSYSTFPLVQERPAPVVHDNPCIPSPCGPYAQCEPNANGSPKCTCLQNYIGSPPNCRPECVSNNDCSKELACINLKCKDPCLGSCGLNARCFVVNHIPNCVCENNYVGDPFSQCQRPCKTFCFVQKNAKSFTHHVTKSNSLYILQRQLLHLLQNRRILAIHRLVERMPDVVLRITMLFVNVYPNIMEILMKIADQNVLAMRIVP